MDDVVETKSLHTQVNQTEKDSTTKELVPLKEGLVSSDHFTAIPVDRTPYPFLYKDTNPHLPKVEGQKKDLSVTYCMTKAGFQEIDDPKFNFLQWKGIFTDATDSMLMNPTDEQKYKWPVTMTHINTGVALGFPLSEFNHGGAEPYVRFVGGAYTEDLNTELAQSNRVAEMTKGHLRMPEIVATIPMPDEIALKVNLPLQEDTAETYKTRLGLDPNIKFEEYDHIGLGENVRKFRNVWRVMDLEQVVQHYNSAEGERKTEIKSDIDTILETSAKVFSKEFNTSIDRNHVVDWFSRILGEQAGILLSTRIIHGALHGHKQDISLAAEIGDFDQTTTVDQAKESYRKYTEGKTDLTPAQKATRIAEENKDLENKCFRQLFTIAGHIKPLLDATNIESDSAKSRKDMAQLFVNGLSKSLSANPEMWKYVLDKLAPLQNDPEAGQKIMKMISKVRHGEDKGLLFNLSDQEEFFGELAKTIVTNFSKDSYAYNAGSV